MSLNRNKKNTEGLILLESLVAIALLTMAVFVLSAIFNNATSSIRVARNYLIGQNLMIEGMEVVKNIRDSNSMIAPNDPECWLFLSPKDLVEAVEAGDVNCNVGVVTHNERYIIVEESGVWKLVSGGDVDADYRLHRAGGIPAATEEVADRLIQGKGLSGGETIFYRSIDFDKTNNSSAEFTVRVWWREGAGERETKDTFTLHNRLIYNNN